MRNVFPALEFILKLRRADDRLQIYLREFLPRYFRFLNSRRTGLLHPPRRLRMRAERDRDGRIRKFSWTKRIQATRIVAGKTQWLTLRLTKPFERAWVYHIAKDWARVEVYEAFDHERTTLNSLRSQILSNIRRLHLSFYNRWASRASAEDRTLGDRLAIEHAADLNARDLKSLPGMVAHQHAVDAAAVELGRTVTDWRQAFAGSITVHFEPALRPNDDGSLRLYWGFPQRVGTPEGTRTFTDYIAGGPSDILMRKLRIPPKTRKQVGGCIKRIRTLERHYRDLVGQVGRHCPRIGKLLAQISKLDSPRGTGGLPSDLRTKPAAGVGTFPKEAL